MHILKLLVLLTISMSIIGCSKHSDYFGENKTLTTFSKPHIVKLPDAVSYATKRKIVDYNCDGFEDIIEVNDEKVGFGEDWQGTVILGTDSNPLSFQNKRTKIKLPQTTGFNSFKIDSAYVNDDKCGDIVFTEYIAKFGSYEYKASVAINLNATGEFKLIQNSHREFLSYEETVMQILSLLFDSYGHYGDSISDYLMIDWGNFNGDEHDDLYILWRDSYDLYVTIVPVVTVLEDDLILGEPIEITIPKFFAGNYSMRHVDTEDFNGDGYLDIIATIRYKDEVKINLATSQFSKDSYSYYVQKEQIGFGADLNLFDFEKVDTFDANKDGCADYAHFGILDGLHKPTNTIYDNQKVVVYKYSSCNL